MSPYKNISRRSSVSSYKIVDASIHVRFRGGVTYVFDERNPGSMHVKKLKVLAEAGKGLGTYIDKNLRPEDFNQKYLEHEPMVKL